MLSVLHSKDISAYQFSHACECCGEAARFIEIYSLLCVLCFSPSQDPSRTPSCRNLLFTMLLFWRSQPHLVLDVWLAKVYTRFSSKGLLFGVLQGKSWSSRGMTRYCSLRIETFSIKCMSRLSDCTLMCMWRGWIFFREESWKTWAIERATSGGWSLREMVSMWQSAHAGLGDRADPSKWERIEGPVKVVSPSSLSFRNSRVKLLRISGDWRSAWRQYVGGSNIRFEQVVLFEGWMLGFEPQEESVVTAIDPQVRKCFVSLTRI